MSAPRTGKRDRIIAATKAFFSCCSRLTLPEPPSGNVTKLGAEAPTSNTPASTPTIHSHSNPACETPTPQPTMESPSPSVYPTIMVDPAEDHPPGRLANITSIGYHGFKTSLIAVRESADAFPPLKSVAGGLLALIDIVEVRNFVTFIGTHYSNFAPSDD